MPKYTDNSPTRVPQEFIPRTLLRILPQVDPTKLSKEELLKFLELKARLTKEISRDPARFFIPNWGGQYEFMAAADPTIRCRFYFAGNKGGKTTAGAIRLIEKCLAQPLWDRDNRADLFKNAKTPVRTAVFAEDFESHKEITLPAIKSWAPPGTIQKMIRNPVGHVVQIEWSNGSITHIKTYEQGSDKAEGKDWDHVWIDEPPPRNVYIAIFRGIVAYDGTLDLTATLIKETWLYDELEHDFVRGYEGTIHDNIWLTDKAKADFISVLDEDERMAREMGKPASLTGVIYKQFKDGLPFVIPTQRIPPECPIIMGVDPHERRPRYVEYGFVNPQNEIIWFDYIFASGSIEETFKILAAKESEFPSKVRLCIMDPNRGRANQIDNRCWQDEFTQAGYYVILGQDNITLGHTALRSYLDPLKPQMRWMESCRGKGGPIWQMTHYSWEDWTHRRIEKSQKEKPKDIYKDFPDIHRYVAMEQLTFEMLYYGFEEVERRPRIMQKLGINAYL